MNQQFWNEVGPLVEGLGTVQGFRMSNAALDGDFDLHGLTVQDTFAADGVQFGGDVRIRGCSFRHAFFMGSEFTSVCRFGNVTFGETCSFRECTFVGPLFAGENKNDFRPPELVDFAGVSFGSRASFPLKAPTATLDFSSSSWSGDAYFEGVEAQSLILRYVNFSTDLLLRHAKIGHTLSLYRSRIEGYCDLNLASAKHLDLAQVLFSRAPELGEMKVQGWAVLDQAVFEQHVRLRLQASTLHCHRTIFQSGVSMSLAGDLIADGTFFSPPSDISGVKERTVTNSPRILSLRRADVAGLSLSDVDLSACLFAGVHHLERSRLGSGLQFGLPPGRWRSSRDILAEEQWLRSEFSSPHDWRGRKTLPAWLEDDRSRSDSPPTLPVDRPVRPDASSVAETYRSLRKAREEGKDSPGAAAFYYGEMEMRRRALRGSGLAGLAERMIVNSYWLLSGYGLRAWRSLLTLAVVMAVSSYVLWKTGFREAETFKHALRVTVASATSLVRPIDDSELDESGFAIEIVLRFLGPLLLALAALALRARIKR